MSNVEQGISWICIALRSLWWAWHAHARTSDMSFLKTTAFGGVFSFTPITCLITLEGDRLACCYCRGVWPGIVCTGVDELFINVLAS